MLSAVVLCVPDDLANVDADERSWRIGHVAKLLEGRLRCPRVLLCVEQPEGMLDDVTRKTPSPVAGGRAGHSLHHRDTPGTDHRECLVRPVRLDLDLSDDCVHWLVLPACSVHERPRIDHAHPWVAALWREGHSGSPAGARASANSPNLLLNLLLILRTRSAPRTRRPRRARAGRAWTKSAPRDAQPSSERGTAVRRFQGSTGPRRAGPVPPARAWSASRCSSARSVPPSRRGPASARRRRLRRGRLPDPRRLTTPRVPRRPPARGRCASVPERAAAGSARCGTESRHG